MDQLPSAEESRTAANLYYMNITVRDAENAKQLKDELNYITAEIKKASAIGERKIEVCPRRRFHSDLYGILESKGYKCTDYDSDNHCSVTTYLTITW